jgi:hypothetical protein
MVMSEVLVSVNLWDSRRLFKGNRWGKEVLVFGSQKDNYMLFYCSETLIGESIQFDKLLIEKELGNIFMDTNDNK